MSKKTRQAECLARLHALNTSVGDITDFLLEEKLMDAAELKALKESHNLAKDLQEKLSTLSTSGKLQLLEFEWVLLPVERIKITMVSDRNSREFTYNY